MSIALLPHNAVYSALIALLSVGRTTVFTRPMLQNNIIADCATYRMNTFLSVYYIIVGVRRDMQNTVVDEG